MPRRFQPDDAVFTEQYLSGMKIIAMAAHWGVSGKAVGNHAERLSLPPRRLPFVMSAQRKKAIIAAMDAGETGYAVARRFDVSPFYVYSIAGPSQSNYRKPRFDWDAAKEAYKSGMTMPEIAAMMGVSKVAVWKAIRGKKTARPTAAKGSNYKDR